MEKISLVRITNPFSPASRVTDLVPYRGETIADILRANAPEDVEFVVSVNGHVVPREHRHLTRVVPGDMIVMRPAVEGGDALKIVAMIAVAAAAWYGGPLLTEALLFKGLGLASVSAGTFMLTQAAIQAGIMMVGGVLVNTLLPVKTPEITSSGYDSSQTYSFSPATLQTQGTAVPRTYGKMKLYGNVIATYVERKNDTNLINALISLGMGPYKSVSDIELNDQPIEDLSDVEAEIRYGKLSQDVITNFNDTKAEYTYSTKVTSADGPRILTTHGSDFDALEVDLCFSSGLYYQNDSGGLDAYSVEIKIEYRKAGDTDWIFGANETVSGSKNSAIYRSYTIASALEHGTYQVRVTKLTEDQSSVRYADELYIASVREVLYDDLTYPRHALVGIKALATDQLSGSLSFSCVAEGAYVRVWDGSTWTIAWSDNPAWVCYDVLTQPVFDDELATVLRYDGIDPSHIDHESFKAWADFCDELVDDGAGGTEKRFVFNGTFDTELTLWEAALKIAQMSRAGLLFIGYKISALVEKASSPVQLFTAGNIVADSFKETFLSLDERAGEIEVEYVNEENDYERDTLTVINSELERPSNRTRIELIGCTKASQAWRVGRFQLLCNQYLKRVIEWQADIDSIVCTLGDVVNFAHPVPKWGIASGRIASAANDPSGKVVLDQEVTLESGKTYVIILRLDDDTLVTKTVADGAGTYTELNLTAPWDAVPTPYCPFALGESATVVKPVRVTKISRDGDQKATIKGIEYNESIYGVDTETPVVPTANYSALEALPSVANLELKERLYKRTDGTIVTVIDVSFSPPASSLFDYAEVWYNTGGGWLYAGKDASGSYSIENVADKATYEIAVRSVNRAGQKQSIAAAPLASIYVFGKTALPEDITDIWAEAAQGGLKLTWTPVGDIDLSYYSIRWTSDLATGSWSNSVEIGMAKSSTVTIPAARSGKYFVKAHDSSGNESANAIAIETTIPAILGWNVQETQAQEPDWPGTKTDMVAADGKLYLNSGASFDDIADFDALEELDYGGSVVASGTYETEPVDLGSVQTARCSIELAFNVGSLDDLFDDISDFDQVDKLDGEDNTNAGIVPQIALSQDGSSWGEWQNFVAGDYTARAFKARLKCYSSDERTYLEISAASFVVDMPDREEAAADVNCPAGGLSVSFGKPFMAVPRLGITAQGMQTGDYYELTNKTVNGFDIAFKDSGGSGVERTLDWAARGY